MIVKFHLARARRWRRSGGLSAGKDRQRDSATVLQGKPEEVRSLSTPRPTQKSTHPASCPLPKGFTAQAARKADGEL